MAEFSPAEDLLIRYLDNELTAEERISLEKKMEADPRVAVRLNELSLAKDAVLYYGVRKQVMEAREIWKQSQQDEKQLPPAKIFRMKQLMRYGAVAASILIAIFVIRGLIGTQVSPQKIYDEMYVGYELSGTRSSKDTASKIVDAYRLKDFRRVVALAAQTTVPSKEKLLLALSYLELNEPANAIAPLKELAVQATLPYHQDAEFYLALAYLRNKDYVNALKLLKQIRANATHPYHDQATDRAVEEIEGLLRK